MVRQLQMEMDDEVFENTHPGCIWGIFHGLNYNYWQKNVKKLLPYTSTKHHLSKYSKGTVRSRTRMSANDSEEFDNLLNVNASPIPVNPKTKKSGSTNKRSLRTRIRSLISEESAKKENKRQPRFQRTYSIHHLECSDYVIPLRSRQSSSRVNQLINQRYYESFNNSDKEHVPNKYETEKETSVDVLEVYRVNKDLFAKARKYTDTKLTRSGTYPSPKSSQLKNFKASKLDHKQNEVWSHPKVDKLFANNIQTQVVDGSTKYSRRTLSLNESSLDRYAQLLPKSSTGDVKLSSSKSLRLTNESSLKRVRSLSLLDSHSLVFVDLDGDRNVENDSRLCKDVTRNDGSEAIEDISELGESISVDDTAEVPKISEEMVEQLVVLKDLEMEEKIDFNEDPENEVPNSSSSLMVQSSLEEDAAPATDFLASEDLKCENNSTVEESSVVSQRNGDESELDKIRYDDFDYVSNILDRSGFKGNDLSAPWYSLDQPLNPSVFDDVEAFWPHEDACSKDEFCCHHQLLFDIINELLVQIYDTSFTYYPRALSSNCHVPSMPVKFSVFDEVWGRIGKIMNSKLDFNQTVDGIVAQDLRSDDRWMNLQLESECVALELEDMFFDELLEEIIFS